MTEMWKMKENRWFVCVGAICIFVLGIIAGALLNKFVENSKCNESDINTSGFITQEMQENLEQLEEFVNYAITRYCNEKGMENQYTFRLLEDMFHYNTYIYAKARYVYDLNKTICSGLADNRFLIEVEGTDSTIYVEVNTYRMKLYVYEEEQVNRIVEGEYADPLLDGMELEECVECDWPEDMWDEEYSTFVLEGWEYLRTPDFEKMRINPDLYGMIIYSLQRYCDEKGIQEMFYFEFPEDKIGNVTVRIFTVKVTSDNRILYMDIDMDRNKVHIYQVE